MTQEEKAKAYDEALERARKIHSEIVNNELLGFPGQIEDIFPQLRDNESEDERIRKELIEFIKSLLCNDAFDRYKLGSWIAWLEKQKEQIPYTDFVIKPHKGDDNNPYDMGVPEAHEYAIKRGFDIPFNYGEVYVDERHLTQTIGNILRWADEHPKEQKPLTEEEFREMSDELYKKHPWYMQKEQKPAEWNKKPCLTCQEYKRGFEAGRLEGLTAGYNKAVKEQKQEWSEEDEEMKLVVLRIVKSLYNWTRYMGDDDCEKAKKAVDWVTNLSQRPQPECETYKSAKHNLAIKFMNYLDENRPEGKMSLSNAECEDIDKAFEEDDWEKIMRYANKYAWKPTDEQLVTLLRAEGVVRIYGTKELATDLAQLYEQLKKL